MLQNSSIKFLSDFKLCPFIQVITRGGIIYRWGATTQCPISSSTNQIYTAARNSRCSQANLAYSTYQLAEGNTSDALLDRHLLRVMLPIKVTHQMCPDSHLITYFYYKGELVSASKHIELEECFANKVSVHKLLAELNKSAETLFNCRWYCNILHTSIPRWKLPGSLAKWPPGRAPLWPSRHTVSPCAL